MSIKKSTSLVIPSTIQPKPRKEDIITAMVERARVKHADSIKEWNEKKTALEKKIEEAAKGEFLRQQPQAKKISIQSWGSSGYVEFRFDVKTPAISKLIDELNALKWPGSFDAAEVKRAIRAGMAGQTTNGVQALLSSPDAVKALDASLAHIGL